MGYGNYETYMQLALKDKIEELSLKVKTARADSERQTLEDLVIRCKNIQIKLSANKEMSREERLVMRDLLLTSLHSIDEKILNYQRQKIKTMTAMKLLGDNWSY